MALLEPFNVAFPVDFRSGGDTTKDAFGKHIQEIERIYGIINAVNADKLSAEDIADKLGKIEVLNDDLQDHINSVKPHPNYKPTFNDITGDLDASRVKGQLPIRVFREGDAFFEDLNSTTLIIPSDITSKNLSKNGYVKFNDSLIIQWGSTTPLLSNPEETAIFTLTFEKTFNTLFTVYTQMCTNKGAWDNENRDIVVRIMRMTNTGFTYFYDYTNAYANAEGMYINYLAIGV